MHRSFLNRVTARHSNATKSGSRAGPRLELLESRRHLSTTLKVKSISADNRGEVTIAFNSAVRASTVSGSSCVLYTPGPDGKIGTADDVRVHAAATYDAAAKTVTIHGRLDLSGGDLGYRVRLVASKLLSATGQPLDGEFQGAGKLSGNGKPGGDTNFKVTAPAGNPTARFSTSFGVIKVALFKDKAAAAVKNFIKYVNRPFYDATIIHRSVHNFIIQGGGYETVLDNNQLPTPSQSFVAIKLTATLSNVAGTIAMARAPDDPSSVTGQYFFNAVDNPQLNASPGNTGYAVFGATDAAGLAVVRAINALPVVDLTPGVTNTAFNEVPKSNGQFVVIRRVSLIDAVTALK